MGEPSEVSGGRLTPGGDPGRVAAVFVRSGEGGGSVKGEEVWRCRLWSGRQGWVGSSPEERVLDAAGAVAWMRSLFSGDPGPVYWTVVGVMMGRGRGVTRRELGGDGAWVVAELVPFAGDRGIQRE